MNGQMIDQLFVDSYLMLNMEISFSGVRSWFQMSGMEVDDITLFKALLLSERIEPVLQSEIARLIVYRYEDVFFQACRYSVLEESQTDPENRDPVHQLLLRMMNIRTLRGEQDALIDLGLALHKDHLQEAPLYPSLHGFFRD